VEEKKTWCSSSAHRNHLVRREIALSLIGIRELRDFDVDGRKGLGRFFQRKGDRLKRRKNFECREPSLE